MGSALPADGARPVRARDCRRDPRINAMRRALLSGGSRVREYMLIGWPDGSRWLGSLRIRTISGTARVTERYKSFEMNRPQRLRPPRATRECARRLRHAASNIPTTPHVDAGRTPAIRGASRPSRSANGSSPGTPSLRPSSALPRSPAWVEFHRGSVKSRQLGWDVPASIGILIERCRPAPDWRQSRAPIETAHHPAALSDE